MSEDNVMIINHVNWTICTGSKHFFYLFQGHAIIPCAMVLKKGSQ